MWESRCRCWFPPAVASRSAQAASLPPCSEAFPTKFTARTCFATDGLHEIRNQQGDDLSWGKLGEIWNQCRCKSADESLDFLFDEVQLFSADGLRHNDITAIALKVPMDVGAAESPAKS
jgi:hypothetical protein